MPLEVFSKLGATQVSDALGQLSVDIARGVVLVRGSRGSAGSGVIWDQPGLVLTNHHVVPGPTAQLTVSDGRRIAARVVRRAPSLDLAALAVEVNLEALAATIGDSDALRVGDLVVAVGNPMGERNAPSVGILASAPHDVLRLAITLRPGQLGRGAGQRSGRGRRHPAYGDRQRSGPGGLDAHGASFPRGRTTR